MKKIYTLFILSGLFSFQFLQAQDLNSDEYTPGLPAGVSNISSKTKSYSKSLNTTLHRTSSMVGCDSLFTTYAGGNGQSGVMFDVVALQALNIEYFYSSFSVITSDVRIYYKTGTYDGSQADSTLWTFIGTANVAVDSTNVPRLIPVPINLSMNVGDTLAFYITRVGPTGSSGTIRYTNGSSVNTLYKADSAMAFYEGIGVGYPFGTNYTPRVWNGTIKYCTLPVGTEETTLTNFNTSTFYDAVSSQIAVEITQNEKGNFSNSEFVLMDIYGKIIVQRNLNLGKNLFSTSGLAKGIYIARVNTGAHTTKQTKLIVY